MIDLQNKQPKILVIGDLMVDHYLWGSCERISPEAPVQVVKVDNESKLLGGAGNVVNNLNALGAEVDVISVIGECETSAELKKLLLEIKVSTCHLIVQKNRVTSKKSRIIAEQQQVVRYDRESTDEINNNSQMAIIKIFKSIINNYEVILLSDYGKGILTFDLTQSLISIASQHSKKLLIDPKGKDYSKYKELKVTKENKILTIAINRPEHMNAVNKQLHGEFSTIFIDAEYDDDIDIVILTGSGKAFCAGGDLKWLLGIHGDPVATSYHISHDRKIQNAMLDMEKPIIAKVNGPAIGLGCSLALFCDFIYATPRSKFADPHVSVGLVAGDGGCVMWPQLIGYARAKKYLLTGEVIIAQDALEMGLITEVIEEDQIDAEVQQLAEKLRDGAKYAIRWTKTSINAGLKVMANSIIDRAAAFENVTQLMEDHKIALQAFSDKETPKFKQK